MAHETEIKTPMTYKAGTTSSPSSIDKAAAAAQHNTYFWLRKALIEARKEQFFTQLSSTVGMPAHFGKEIKVDHYIPLLDDRNKNDQGIDATGAYYENGNLYGSSRDIGAITSRLPVLSETGGRVNRVGFTRLSRKGSIQKFGFFTEFTQESLDFDSDEQLFSHISTELMNGAVQLTEAVLQKDLLTQAGINLFAGKATNKGTVSGEPGALSVVTYADLKRMDRALTDNRTPTDTKIITGSRMIDTKTLSAARIAYVGPDVVPLLENMVDSHNNPAWIPVHQYANAGQTLVGEIGACAGFRFIRVPEMLYWAGQGATKSTETGYQNNGSKYNVFPILVVGSESFVTIGFQASGKGGFKFDVITKMPGADRADRNDPYGETGFSSIKWYYGTLITRPERIGVLHTVAPI